MIKRQTPKQILTGLFNSALNAVYGCSVVEQQLKLHPIKGDVAIVAIGKAAAAMMLGAKNELNEQIQSALIITKVGHADKSLGWSCIEAAHPIPDAKSLEAGDKLVEFLSNIPSGTNVMDIVIALKKPI